MTEAGLRTADGQCAVQVVMEVTRPEPGPVLIRHPNTEEQTARGTRSRAGPVMLSSVTVSVTLSSVTVSVTVLSVTVSVTVLSVTVSVTVSSVTVSVTLSSVTVSVKFYHYND